MDIYLLKGWCSQGRSPNVTRRCNVIKIPTSERPSKIPRRNWRSEWESKWKITGMSGWEELHALDMCCSAAERWEKHSIRVSASACGRFIQIHSEFVVALSLSLSTRFPVTVSCVPILVCQWFLASSGLPSSSTVPANCVTSFEIMRTKVNTINEHNGIVLL